METNTEILNKLYAAYGTDSGILFGIKERSIVEAIVNFAIDYSAPLDNEDKEIEKLENDLHNSNTGTPPKKEETGFSLIPYLEKELSVDGITQGEWKLNDFAITSTKGIICHLHFFRNGDKDKIIMQDEAEANAKLIASAPQLHKDNERLLNQLNEQSVYESLLRDENESLKLRVKELETALQDLVERTGQGKRYFAKS